MRLLCLLVCASAVAIACAGAGGATFPGRNGLVVSSESTPFGDAIEVNATGGGATPVLPSGVALAGPVVPSPDGTRLAYTTALFDAGPDFISGPARRRRSSSLIAPTFRELAPDWSPRRLAGRVHGTRSAPSRSPRGSFVDVAERRRIGRASYRCPVTSRFGPPTVTGSRTRGAGHRSPSRLSGRLGRPPDRAGHRLRGRSPVWSAAWSADSKHLAIAAEQPHRSSSRRQVADRGELAEGYYPIRSRLVAGLGDHRVCRERAGHLRSAQRVLSWRRRRRAAEDRCVVLVLRRPLVHVVVG